MSRSPPLKQNILAERLLGYEIDLGDEPAAFRVCEKLRQVLGKLLGTAGFQALLARALTLARAEAPALRAVKINAQGSLEGLSQLEPRARGGRVSKGEVVLVATLLRLLVTFIGEALTQRLVEDAWPEASLDGLAREKGTKS